MYNKDSAANLISRLKVGQTFSRSTFIPGGEVTPEQIIAERKRLTGILSPVIARVRENEGSTLRLHTTTSFTNHYDVIVSVVVLREEDEV